MFIIYWLHSALQLLRDFLIKELYEKHKIQCVVQYYPCINILYLLKKDIKKQINQTLKLF